MGCLPFTQFFLFFFKFVVATLWRIGIKVCRSKLRRVPLYFTRKLYGSRDISLSIIYKNVGFHILLSCLYLKLFGGLLKAILLGIYHTFTAIFFFWEPLRQLSHIDAFSVVRSTRNIRSARWYLISQSRILHITQQTGIGQMTWLSRILHDSKISLFPQSRAIQISFRQIIFIFASIIAKTL